LTKAVYFDILLSLAIFLSNWLTKINMKNNRLLEKLVSLKFLLISLLTFILIIILAGLSIVGIFNQNKDEASASVMLDTRLILIRINQERVKKGINPLEFESRLESAAKAKSDDMANLSYFNHYSPSGKRGISFIPDKGYSYLVAAENLAIFFDNVDSLVNEWMQSPTHRQNILNPEYTQTGIAVSLGNFEGNSANFIAQMFATPKKQIIIQQPSPAPVNNQPETTPQQNPAPKPPVDTKKQQEIERQQVIQQIQDQNPTTGQNVAEALRDLFSTKKEVQ
jgi:hypothetical protein